ncbi:hypothetical protein [Lyngbya confervoides]|uniref:Lipoprotein n=1 Tax=Lyngbya confervoides BDU141951 TaxID=1574623 RepID=A0ABD4T330_9CYAN|nr:hypothetical protein [Lyngbya confervoides]MCM1982957.1 hypothetical protein [Lyngbya confervoides BDU141951]
MKNSLAQGLRLLILGLALSGILWGCVSKTPLSEAQQPYAGRWEAPDGTYIHIYLDGGGDFKASNSSVEGGAVTFKGETFTIGLGPIKKSFQVTQPPQQQGAEWVMALDGVTYRKTP